jgi:vacuolar-type H+-ATPase subunit E/Vma4
MNTAEAVSEVISAAEEHLKTLPDGAEKEYLKKAIEKTCCHAETELWIR